MTLDIEDKETYKLLKSILKLPEDIVIPSLEYALSLANGVRIPPINMLINYHPEPTEELLELFNKKKKSVMERKIIKQHMELAEAHYRDAMTPHKSWELQRKRLKLST